MSMNITLQIALKSIHFSTSDRCWWRNLTQDPVDLQERNKDSEDTMIMQMKARDALRVVAV